MNMEIMISGDLIRRISKRIDLDKMRKLCGVDYLVAGGCMRAEKPNDYDLYAASSDHPFELEAILERCGACGWTLVAETRNSLTMKDGEGHVFQFCRYAKKSAQHLIQSFDFAHCQVGVKVWYGSRQEGPVFTEAIYTPNFIKAMALQKTFFCGTEYPLSSLIRLTKYAKRGLYGAGRGYMGDVVKILTALIKRGYDNYGDFKDQLDAVDLSFDENGSLDLWDAVETRFRHD